jgi:hypothetical protein
MIKIKELKRGRRAPHYTLAAVRTMIRRDYLPGEVRGVIYADEAARPIRAVLAADETVPGAMYGIMVWGKRREIWSKYPGCCWEYAGYWI